MEKVDIEAAERKAGSIARAALKVSLITQIKKSFHKRTGLLEKSNVSAKYKESRLDRLTINSPVYSFTSHYGSSLTGTQKATTRKPSNVSAFQRHLKGETIEVKAHSRSGGSVSAMNKNMKYPMHNHLSRALKETQALEVLATSLGNNRMVLITSQIDF